MTYAKALVGASIAGLTAVATGLTDGALTAQEWVASAVAALVTLGAVWAIPNAAPSRPDAAFIEGGRMDR